MTPPRIHVPVDLLLQLHQAADATAREALEAYIREYKARVDQKGHVAEGFRRAEDGSLVFDYGLYDEAVYRGKIETYAERARKEIEDLQHSLTMVGDFTEDQRKALAAIPATDLAQRIGLGKAVSLKDLELISRVQLLLGNDREA